MQTMINRNSGFLCAALLLALLAGATAQPAPVKSARPAPRKAAPQAQKPAAPAVRTQTASQPEKAAKQTVALVQTPFDKAAGKLGSKDPGLRRQGAEMLAQGRDPRAAAYLVSALSDESAPVRAAAVDGLCQLVYRPALPKVLDALAKDKDAMVRQQAASSLVYMPDPSAGSALIEALGDDAMAVRYAAANTLGAMRYAPAEDRLIALLDDAGMRRVAIYSLGQLQSRKAARKILGYLSDQDKYTRLEAVRALGSIGDKDAARELTGNLDRKEDPSVRVESALALAKLGQADGLLTAYEFVKSQDLSLKTQALEVIGAVGDKRSLQFIEELYKGEQNPANKSMLDFTRQRLALRLASQAKP